MFAEKKPLRPRKGRRQNRRIWAVTVLAVGLAQMLSSLPAVDSGRGERAAPPAPLVIPRLVGPVKLDGVSEERAWQSVPIYRFVSHSPVFGLEPSERTELLLAHDDSYLYVAGRLFDREPGKIQANSKARDSTDSSSDWFGVVIDSFNDKENAVAFFTTPAGLRWDAAVANDAIGNQPLNFDWNSFWDVAVSRNGQGWFAEMRIPVSSLRFQTRDGRVVMGIISWRSIARKNEWVIFPDIPPDWGFWSLFKPSQAREFAMEGVRSRTPLYVTPYILGGLGQEAVADGTGGSYRLARRSQRDVGADLKYGLTSNLTLDMTVNPDFAQVEADDQQVNLTRFSLFFPEKRQFFQERASVFDFGFESSEPNRLFDSRRIGLDGDRQVSIYGGARLIGRMGEWDVGILDMHAGGSGGLGAENFGVFRLRRQVFNPYSYAGGILTSRIGGGGRSSLTYGLDAQVRVFGDDYAVLRWAQSFENGQKSGPFSLAPARIFAKWVRNTNKGLGYGISFSRGGRDYDPGIGFEIRRDFSRYVGSVFYGLVPGKKSRWFMHTFSLTGILWSRNADKTLESGYGEFIWRLETKSGFVGIVSPRYFVEDVRRDFSLSEGAVVPPGRYAFWAVSTQVATPSGRALSLEGKVDVGGFYDGRKITILFSPLWSVSASLGFGADYEFDRAVFPGRGQTFTAHIGRFRILAMMSVKLSAAALVQYSSAGKVVSGNFRLRYNPREGVDLYVVYNESLNTDRFRAAPVLPLTAGRVLLLKSSYAFNF